MLMVNDRNSNSDSFWFTLFHEIGHIMNGDYGISFESESGEREEIANKYAEDKLIPYEQYERFIEDNIFDIHHFYKRVELITDIVLANKHYTRKEKWINYLVKSMNEKVQEYADAMGHARYVSIFKRNFLGKINNSFSISVPLLIKYKGMLLIKTLRMKFVLSVI
jgi:Zn-dependent peptidase ImmA (M78 family)